MEDFPRLFVPGEETSVPEKDMIHASFSTRESLEAAGIFHRVNSGLRTWQYSGVPAVSIAVVHDDSRYGIAGALWKEKSSEECNLVLAQLRSLCAWLFHPYDHHVTIFRPSDCGGNNKRAAVFINNKAHVLEKMNVTESDTS